MPTDKIMTARPSTIPKIAMRTLSLENVRLDLKVMRREIKAGRFKPEMFFCTLAKMHFFPEWSQTHHTCTLLNVI